MYFYNAELTSVFISRPENSNSETYLWGGSAGFADPSGVFGKVEANDFGFTLGYDSISNLIWNPNQQANNDYWTPTVLSLLSDERIELINNFNRVATAVAYGPNGAKLIDLESGFITRIPNIFSTSPDLIEPEMKVNALNDQGVSGGSLSEGGIAVAFPYGFVSANGKTFALNNRLTEPFYERIIDVKKILSRGDILAYKENYFLERNTMLLISNRPLSCLGDLNADGRYTDKDLRLMLQLFGTKSGKADINSDGVVNTSDLRTVVSRQGKTCSDLVATPLPIKNISEAAAAND